MFGCVGSLLHVLFGLTCYVCLFCVLSDCSLFSCVPDFDGYVSSVSGDFDSLKTLGDWVVLLTPALQKAAKTQLTFAALLDP